MLPKINYPTYEFVIPSTKKKEMFRPFLVKEEKILLMSKSSNDVTDMFRAIKQVINNCAISTTFNIDKLPIFDLEYLFLQLRAVSINNIAKVAYRDNEDQQVYDFEIDISQIKVNISENIENLIKVNKSLSIKMRYPQASIFNDKSFFKFKDESYFELILKSIDKIYHNEDIYEADDASKEELEEFLDNLDAKSFEKIQAFIDNTPTLYHELNYVNQNGNARKIIMNSINDFFTLG
jgi:hypothetical protein